MDPLCFQSWLPVRVCLNIQTPLECGCRLIPGPGRAEGLLRINRCLWLAPTCFLFSFSNVHLFSTPHFSHCLSCPEEMRDLTESSDADSVPTVGIQSKGKRPWKDLPRSLSQLVSCGTSLFISRCLLVSSATKLKFPPPDNPSALCSRVLHGFTLHVPVFLPPVCFHLPLPVRPGSGRVCVSFLQGQMHL